MSAIDKPKGFGYYNIIDEIGKGGMGTVFSALDTKLKRKVAIKHLDLNSSENKDNSVYLFKREAIAIAKLNHPNIVNIYDIGQEEDGNYYIVMELIEGKPLSTVVKLHSLSPETYITIAIQICDALSYIHENDVIHRDIKPENIIISSKGNAKLTDFGVAKFDEDEWEKEVHTSFVGTLIYMSPEQLHDSDNVDQRSDVYSFAATLYELLTGVPPFYSDEPRNLILKILSEEPKAPSKINKNLSESLDRVMLKALAKNREERYSNADEFSNALSNIPEYKRYLEKNNSQSKSNKQNIFESNNTVKEPEPNLPLPDLQWLEQLDFLIKDADNSNDKDSFFIQSLVRAIPEINNNEYRNLIKTFKTFGNIHETISFLSLFEGGKSIRHALETNNDKSFFYKITEYTNKNLLPKKVLEIINSLNFNVNYTPELAALLEVLKKFKEPNDVIALLELINNVKSLKAMITEKYSMDKLDYIFSILYECNKKDIVNIKCSKPLGKSENIFIGDMLVAFSYITQSQLNLAVKEKESNAIKSVIKEGEADNDRIGEMLVKLGFLDNDKLFNVLKLQPWYKGFFLKPTSIPSSLKVESEQTASKPNPVKTEPEPVAIKQAPVKMEDDPSVIKPTPKKSESDSDPLSSWKFKM